MSTRRYFHGGVPNLKIGGYILPPCETGRGGAGLLDRVYITTDVLQELLRHLHMTEAKRGKNSFASALMLEGIPLPARSRLGPSHTTETAIECPVSLSTL